MFDTKFWAIAFFALSSAGLGASIHLNVRSGKITTPRVGFAPPTFVLRSEQPRLFLFTIALETMLAATMIGCLLFISIYW